MSRPQSRPQSVDDAPVRKTKILRELREIGERLARVPDDHARRIVLFREGHSAGLLHSEMGAACGVSESAVSKALKRDEMAVPVTVTDARRR